MTLDEGEAYKQAIQAYTALTKKYKSPKDIPEDVWVTGNDMEIGKWYLWVDGGHDLDLGVEFSEQHLIMIPKMFEGRSRIQTIKDFDVLWYLTGIDGGQVRYNLYRKNKEVIEWMPKELLTITLDSFGLVESKKYVIGPLEYDSKSFFMNWQESPFEVK